jgi:hypothetical protein
MCSHVPDIINLNVSCCNGKDTRVPLEEQELVILPKHLSSIPVLVGVRVAQSLGFFAVLYGFFSFGHCIVCPSSVYDF